LTFLFSSKLTISSIIHPNYSKTQNEFYDIAILNLKEDIGSQLGFAALSLIDPSQINLSLFRVHVAGFPASKTFRSYFFQQERCLYDMEGSIIQLDDKKIYYDIDTSGGQSGAGIWNLQTVGERLEDQIMLCYGIHTQGMDGIKKGNSDVRFTQEIMDFIFKNAKI